MADRLTRSIACLLVAEALALTGCGRSAPVAAPAARLVALTARPAASAPLASAPLAAPVAAREVVTSREVVAGPDPVRPSVFREDFSLQRYQAGPAAEAAVAREVEAEMAQAGGASWTKVGGGLVAGLVGTSLLGYFAYAGQVGARDLMTPEKTDLHQDPSHYGIPFEAVRFHSHDGLQLAGWYVPAAAPTTKGLVLFHGHTSNKDRMFEKYGSWLHQKYNLFVYDSRYHGESEGRYTTLGYYEQKDALIALDQLRARGNTRIGVLGESMGGAVAIEAAAADPRVKAVLSDCAFDSLHDAIAPRAAARRYPLADGVATAVVATVSLKAHARVVTADPIRVIAKLAPRPLLLVHGQKDDDTTPINGEKLFEAAQEPKQIWRTPEADHAESVEKYPEEYHRRALAFFEAAL